MTERESERGTVTAELAIGLPVVVLVLVAVLTLAAASTAQMRAMDAARAGARAVAIGEQEGGVNAAVARVGGPEAELQLVHEGRWVRVTVTRPVAGGWLSGPLRATGTAAAWVEP
ncbi:TadE family type IV pilus minor pilin [Promicromonospora aerolata]|uniref:TadE family type IV pilus minor pilin n=1 Tax=Promicromonospora aerolata TaxID=195749 RepID=A0ABW4V8G8_9MICO